MRPHLVASSANGGTVRLPWVTYRVPWADDAATVVATVARSLAQRNSTYHATPCGAHRQLMCSAYRKLEVTRELE
jgi:hypothetical protein